MSNADASSMMQAGMADEAAAPPRVMALVPVDLARSSLLPWQPSRAAHRIQGRSVLARTLGRVARIAHLQGIIVICPAAQARDVGQLLAETTLPLPVHLHEVAGPLHDQWHEMVRIGRLVHPEAWRAGLGGATPYDEVLCPQPMAEALKARGATAGVIVGPDWLLVDPAITSQVVGIHVEHPQAMQMAFSQAPPGLAGVVIAGELLEQMGEKGASVGQLISYNPQRPQADPIGRDVCAQIPAAVRDCPARLIYDTPRATALLDKLVSGWSDEQLQQADAMQVAVAARALGDEAGDALLPREVTLELTPRRAVAGPLLPQYHVKLSRPDASLDMIAKLLAQLGQAKDTFLMLGGLGDALLHPQWRQVVTMARDAGVAAVGIETDLLVDQATLTSLLDSPVDVISVRLNADTAGTYQQQMTAGDPDGPALFKQCLENLQWLLNTRNARWQSPPEAPPLEASSPEREGSSASNELAKEKIPGVPGLPGGAGVPWIVPSLVKANGTFGDMETFFDRWMVYTGAAVIAPHQTGCGLMPDDSPVRMTPPRRQPCRQLARRLTILSDGSIALCDQDWLGRDIAGHVRDDSLTQAMTKLRQRRQMHEQAQWDGLPLCGRCGEWFRP